MDDQGATQEDAVNIAAVKHGIIEYVYAIRDTLRKLYDTDLMQGGGHIRGYAVEGEAAKQVTEAFAAKQNSCGGFLFAVGDGTIRLQQRRPAGKISKNPKNSQRSS